MTRKLKENTCKACGYTFVAKDRNYKSTCSGACSVRIQIRVAMLQAVAFGEKPVKIFHEALTEVYDFEEQHKEQIYNKYWSKFKG